jgi:hypothetical protein
MKPEWRSSRADKYNRVRFSVGSVEPIFVVKLSDHVSILSLR